MTLFRKEAIEAKSNKMLGDVYLISPVSFDVITYLLGFLVFIILIFVLSASYSRVENVQGYLVPKAGLVKIRAQQFGTLRSLNVKEGQLVAEGEILATVEAAQLDKNGLSTKDKTLKIIAQERQNLLNQMTLLKGQLTSELARISNDEAIAEFNISSLKTQLALQKTLTESAQKSFKDIQSLLKKGFISSAEAQQRQQNSLVQQTRMKLKEQELNDAQFKLNQLTVQRQQQEERNSIQISQLKSELLRLNSRETDLIDKGSYAIRSPKKAKVGSIFVDSVGDTIVNQQAMLTLLPIDQTGSSLLAEMYVPSRAIGFVKLGQEVKILYDAFPSERFGAFSAKVVKLTKTIISPDDNSSPIKVNYPFYRVVAELEKSVLKIDGNSIALQPGMTFQANIIQEKRSIIEWILEPFMRLRGR